MNIKDMVKDNKKVRYTHYRFGELWYVTECGFKFPVPVVDCGDASFMAEDKAILFMRYIRKHIEMIDKELEAMAAQSLSRDKEHHLGCILMVTGGLEGPCDCGGRGK